MTPEASPAQLTVQEALRQAAARLAGAPGGSPRLTAEVLLGHLLGLERSGLLSQPERNLSPEQLSQFFSGIERAAQGEPLAYLIGRREFCGLDFFVDANVLVPRPETELLVDVASGWLAARPPETRPALRILDVGTGSGCIAVTLAVRFPEARLLAVDLSAEALEVARRNALCHNVAGRITFVQADLLAPWLAAGPVVDLLCANLPYIAPAELPSLAVARHEPRLALDGGSPDGLNLIRSLLAQAPRVMACSGALLLEIGAGQAEAAARLAQAAFPGARCEVRRDLADLDRLLGIWL